MTLSTVKRSRFALNFRSSAGRFWFAEVLGLDVEPPWRDPRLPRLPDQFRHDAGFWQHLAQCDPRKAESSSLPLEALRYPSTPAPYRRRCLHGRV